MCVCFCGCVTLSLGDRPFVREHITRFWYTGTPVGSTGVLSQKLDYIMESGTTFRCALNYEKKIMKPTADFERRVDRFIKAYNTFKYEGRTANLFPALYSLITYCIYRNPKEFIKDV